jgi:transcriptional regulator with XRE-family HTH domain
MAHPRTSVLPHQRCNGTRWLFLLTATICGCNVTMWYIVNHARWRNMFGEYIKSRRLERELSLREFSRRIEEDPSNWSKVERGVLPPVRDRVKLSRIASVLGIEQGSDEWKKLEDYADIDTATIPEYIMNDREALAALPAFFRTVGSLRPSREEIEALLKNLKEG